MSVVLITGGWNDDVGLRSYEIFDPVTKERCSIPQLPRNRYYHSQNGGLVCGGSHSEAKTNCAKWSPTSGNWTQSHTLRHNRYHHVSWATASGVYLIGGYESPRTSEKVKLDSSVEEGFNLKYDKRLKTAFHWQLVNNLSLAVKLARSLPTRRSSSLEENKARRLSQFTARLAGREIWHH